MWLGMTSMISHLQGGWQRAATRRKATRFARAATQIHGPVLPVIREDEAVLLVTQWRVSDLSGFFAHYQRLGVQTFVFFAAHAPTAALEQIKAQPGTIIIESGLRVAAPEDHVLAYLAETYGKNCWCLNVRTDELLEFEGKSDLGLSGLIGYLKAQRATSLVAHRLEMFPKGSLGALVQMDLMQKIIASVYFDLTSVRKVDRFHPTDPAKNGPQIVDLKHDAPDNYVDMQGEVASVHPLVFNATNVTLHPAPTAPDGVRYADVTAVLKCYGRAAQTGETTPDAELFSLAARRWNRAALLVRAGFLQGSDQFSAWLKEHST
jgi:hypothetical protein